MWERKCTANALARAARRAAVALTAISLLAWSGNPLPQRTRSLLDGDLGDSCYVDRLCSANGTINTARSGDLIYIAGDSDTTPPRMTWHVCKVLAASRGFEYAALQRGHICFGTQSISGLQQAPAGQCDIPCSANAQEACGGYCRYSIVRSNAGAFVHTGWTDNRTDASQQQPRDENPQICPPGLYIYRWVVGVDRIVDIRSPEPAQLRSIQGVCGAQGNDDSEMYLQPLVGLLGFYRKDYGGPFDNDQGFTCSTLERNGVTQSAADNPSLLSIAKFLKDDFGLEPNSTAHPWSICSKETSSDWVAIGYEGVTGDAVTAMRFILASKTTIKSARSGEPLPTATPGYYELGCYEDQACLDRVEDLQKRALPYLGSDDSTSIRSNPISITDAISRYKCAVLAAANGYPLAAVEDGPHCFGAMDTTELVLANKNKCDRLCAETDDACGGTCHFSVYRIPDGMTAKYAARTDNKTGSLIAVPKVQDVSTSLADLGPRVCRDQQYITHWTLGLGRWKLTGDAKRLVHFQASCSNGHQLVVALGDVRADSHQNDAYPYATEKWPLLNSQSGFACSMLQQGGVTDYPDPRNRDLVAVATFLGQGQPAPNGTLQQWDICPPDLTDEWVAIGYEVLYNDVINSLRFIFAPRNLVNAIYPATRPNPWPWSHNTSVRATPSNRTAAASPTPSNPPRERPPVTSGSPGRWNYHTMLLKSVLPLLVVLLAMRL